MIKSMESWPGTGGFCSSTLGVSSLPGLSQAAIPWEAEHQPSECSSLLAALKLKPLLPKHRYYFKRPFATSYRDDNVSPISFTLGLGALKMLSSVIAFFNVRPELSEVCDVLNGKGP